MEDAMSLWGRFGEEIARTEDEMLAGDERLVRVRQRLLATASKAAAGFPGRSTGGRPVLAFGLAAAAVVAMGVTAAIFAARDPSAIEATVDGQRRTLHAGDWVAASAEAARRIDFSDGSSVFLEPRSGARVVTLGANGAQVSLERGTARFSVQKRKNAQWQVDVGPYAVAVKGTHFVVGWVPEAQLFTLTLEEGSVLVHGPLLAEGRMVAVGETLRASVSDSRLEIFKGGRETAAGGETAVKAPAPKSSAPELVAEDTESADTACAAASGTARESFARSTSSAPGAVPPEDWRQLARVGSYEAAVESAEQLDLDSVMADAAPSDLLLLGDAARLARRLDLADRSYLAARAKHPGSPESVAAAFALGRLAFDHQHLYAKAARWMEVYLTEGGEDATLAREALGRLIEASERAGDPDGAKNAAARYLARYPNGPHADVARRALSHKESGAVAAP
jgi:transmembrane sensor